ncbi:MAG: tRNA (guanosine(37)-N1)-methyltransferase TrmD [Acidobacteria bacterium]|nr:tRNA (guanosine(37)-N1)-methyltransferase TrmD [Acidobacteriota bacterium]
MKFDIVTIFPRMVDAFLAEGVVARAAERGILDPAVHDLRRFAADRRGTVDDVPYGGGPGMVMKPEPFVRAVEQLREQRGSPDAVVLMSPQGTALTHAKAVQLSRLKHIVLLCGRYEGIDERVREQVATEELSIGDYVVSGGELPAMVVVEAVARQLPGVVGDAESVRRDSFVRNLLDWPHYTRPADLDGARVPDVLISGNHAEIRRWRKRSAVRRTLERRPELLEQSPLDEEEREILRDLRGSD